VARRLFWIPASEFARRHRVSQEPFVLLGTGNPEEAGYRIPRTVLPSYAKGVWDTQAKDGL
jgi:hypothetical protein